MAFTPASLAHILVTVVCSFVDWQQWMWYRLIDFCKENPTLIANILSLRRNRVSHIVRSNRSDCGWYAIVCQIDSLDLMTLGGAYQRKSEIVSSFACSDDKTINIRRGRVVVIFSMWSCYSRYWRIHRPHQWTRYNHFPSRGFRWEQKQQFLMTCWTAHHWKEIKLLGSMHITLIRRSGTSSELDAMLWRYIE